MWNCVYGIVCLVNDNYMYRMVGLLVFMQGLTHHTYPTSKYSIGITRVWGHCHHIEGNYSFVLKCMWNYCFGNTSLSILVSIKALPDNAFLMMNGPSQLGVNFLYASSWKEKISFRTKLPYLKIAGSNLLVVGSSDPFLVALTMA